MEECLKHLCAERDIPYYSIAMTSKKDICALFRLYKLLKKLKPDVLHTYLFHANTLGRIIGKLLRIPVIISGQRNVDLWRKWYHNVIDRFTSKYCSVIISNSVAGKSFLVNRVGIPSTKIEVIHNGVQLSLPQAAEPSRSDFFTILNIASLTEKKGQEYLIMAFSSLAEVRVFQLNLSLLGMGNFVYISKRLLMSKAFFDYVSFEGFKKNVNPYLSCCDIFVLPSLWEGLPVALMEAMACR